MDVFRLLLRFTSRVVTCFGNSTTSNKSNTRYLTGKYLKLISCGPVNIHQDNKDHLFRKI